MSVKEIGRALARAGRLSANPLCVMGADEPPEGAEPLASIDRCVGKAVYLLAIRDMPPAYIGPSARAGCCPGGQSWMGLTSFPEGIKYFVSTGTPQFRGGACEYLKRSPEMVEESVASVGKITMPSENLVILPTENVTSENRVLCIVLFGKAESIRNLCALHHFGSTDTMMSAIMPWGPACASLITYPSGMASNAPCDAVFLGTSDPTVNVWFPPDLMSLSIPIHVASRMVGDLDRSFIIKRPNVAFPEEREEL